MGNIVKLTERIAGRFDQQHNSELKNRIKDYIIDDYATFIRRDFERTGLLPNNINIPLSCLSVIAVDVNECCDEDLGCDVFRTELKLPNLIQLKGLNNYTYIGGTDKKSPYTYVTISELGLVAHRKFTKKKLFYTELNNYIYFINGEKLNSVTVIAPFEDLRQVKLMKDCFGKQCFNPDEDLNIPGNFATIIEDVIFQRLANSNIEDTKEIKANG